MEATLSGRIAQCLGVLEGMCVATTAAQGFRTAQRLGDTEGLHVSPLGHCPGLGQGCFVLSLAPLRVSPLGNCLGLGQGCWALA
ncbi:hypothetical protein AMTR_s00074p00185290 [Amborella trichopoda]|uniref:Uncharacterized protein n=1 Tax=Amborella trichopoda TaxID=13333 RepID=W1NN42_AMBTC|nr:hypothetical protein AMTR_s00074p00185290 [Amborella trichopoda]